MINKSTRIAAGCASGGRARLRLRTAALGLAALAGATACKDTVVPNFRSPQINPGSPSGIQFLATGVINASRNDMGQVILSLGSFDRDMGVFTSTDQRFITEWMGNGTAIPNSDFYGAGAWANEFRAANDAQFIINQLPSVAPAYSASDASLIAGMMKTLEAYNMLLVAETRDTLGVPVFGFAAPTTAPAPILCTKDVWAGIVAMLDSAETELDAGTPGPLPLVLPPGYTSVAGAGPSTTAGSFGGLNRALAAYANLQLAYAVARSPGGTPATPTTPGAPSVAALTAADSALHHTFLFDSTALTQPVAGDFTDPLAVYHNFSGTSGDLVNQVTFAVGQVTTVFVLDTVATEFGTDKRANKLMINATAPNAPCVGCNDIAKNQVTVNFYTTPSSPVPIIRNEELVLIEAMVQLGMGNFANAVAALNAVHVKVGGGAPLVNPGTYVGVRDLVLHELRLSNIGEPGAERLLAIRNYGLEAQQTTTWGAVDTHATVLPIPIDEAGPRNGNIAYSCP